ncbi:hypothetical protein B0H12DRAFT_1079445 [Mycena haematopus]|nr:hypothetical protein B0H12DRAFT_1079445 [Mycena haematopus]
MNKSALAGSSPANPWCLDENGDLVLQSVKQATATLRYVAQRGRAYRGAINSGPPSSIRQNTPQEIAARARSRHGAHRDPTFAALAAQVRARAAAEARARAAAFTPGSRTVRVLLERDLYLDKIRPPTDVQAKDHHQCAICTGMLSHPVSWVRAKFYEVACHHTGGKECHHLAQDHSQLSMGAIPYNIRVFVTLFMTLLCPQCHVNT